MADKELVMADNELVFPDGEVTYREFFTINQDKIRHFANNISDKRGFIGLIFNINNEKDDITVKFAMAENKKDDMIMNVYNKNKDKIINDVTVLFTKISIKESEGTKSLDFSKKTTGGRKVSIKKEICGKLRCIYKIPGSRKEHIKYKGRLIAVADYKKLMKKA